VFLLVVFVFPPIRIKASRMRNFPMYVTLWHRGGRDETSLKLSRSALRERLVGSLKSLGKLRVKTSHGSLLVFGALLLTLFIAFTIRIFPLRWEIETGSLHLSEFDAFFEYRVAYHMWQNGLFSPYWPQMWVDPQLWHPMGVNMGADSLPSIPMTGAFLYDLVRALGINIDLMSFCSFLPPIFGTLCVLILYFIGKEIGGRGVGLLAALFLALDSSFIGRSNLGWFETETATFAFLLFFLLFPRAIDDERPIGSTIRYSLVCGACLAYFILGWGAAYYLLDLSVLFVFVLILLRRATRRVLLAYSLTFGLGLLITINAPIMSVEYLTTFAVLPVAGVFLLLCLNEFLRNLASAKEKLAFAVTLLIVLISGFAIIFASGRVGSISGKFLTVLDPFLRGTVPLVESVAEHRITAWGSIYYEYGIVILFFMVGLFFVSRNLSSNRNLFLLLFGLTAVYFSASMVRLLFLLASAFGLIFATGTMGVLNPFIVLLKEPPKITRKKLGLEHVGKEFSGVAVFLIFLILMTNLAISPQTGGIPNVYRQAYAPLTITVASLPIVPTHPVNEWLNLLQWTSVNLKANTVVCSWWDYGFWLTMVGNVTTLTDNLTINSTSIENTGYAFMANETQSLKMLRTYNVEYVLVFITLTESQPSGSTSPYAGWVGYGDEGKWVWMAKISGEAESRLVDEGYMNDQYSWTNETTFGHYNSTTGAWMWNDAGTNSTIYKLMSWGKQRWCDQNSVSPDVTGVEPTYFKEAYFAGETLSYSDAQSSYGAGIIPLVCIYKIDWQAFQSDYPGQ
jgi:dolichyl-diphosphooligosaccharide--protein glycosyltransferase